MYGVEEITFVIKESPEVHHVAPHCSDVFDSYKITYKPHLFTNMMHQLFCFYITTECCPQKVKGANCYRETQQFQFVERIFNGLMHEHRQFKVFSRGGKQLLHGRWRSSFSKQHVRIPK